MIWIYILSAIVSILMTCSCGKPSENRTTGLCASCSRAERKSEADALKIKKVYRIPKQSPKMKEDLKTYSKLRDWYLKDHPECELMLIGCTKVAIEIHHIDSRGLNLNRVETWKSACRHCHKTLHDKLSAKEARDLGLKK